MCKKFAIFTGKKPCWVSFSIKLQAFRSVTLLKRDSNTDIFLWISPNFKENLFWATFANHNLSKWTFVETKMATCYVKGCLFRSWLNKNISYRNDWTKIFPVVKYQARKQKIQRKLGWRQLPHQYYLRHKLLHMRETTAIGNSFKQNQIESRKCFSAHQYQIFKKFQH